MFKELRGVEVVRTIPIVARATAEAKKSPCSVRCGGDDNRESSATSAASATNFRLHNFEFFVRDPLGNVSKICYNTFNAPVSVTDANGIVTKYSCNDAGLVTRMERLDGSETLTSLVVSYDGAGRPVSYTDQDGLAKSFERDAFGKVLKERFPDGSECAYSYDALGRRTSVIDENGHEIRFGWGRFGLKSRTTAAGQLTDYVRDDLGLVKEVVSTWNGSEDRRISSEYDEFGRLTYADYGNGEIERFEYDKRNRLAKHTRGKTEETYKYDHFGRLVEKRENGLATSYTYDAYGSRLSRVTKNRQGEVVSKENRAYDKFGRLAETAAGFGAKVTYAYDSRGRLARQIVDASPIEYEYTKYGQLAGKYLGGRQSADASVVYEYSKSGQIVARTANGVRQTYEYDRKGQLLAVKDDAGNAVERYAYDKAGNMLRKTLRRVRCRISPERSEPRSGLNEGCALAADSGDDYITTTFTFDAANQLVSSTTDGVTTHYSYDAAGRLVTEGNKTYRYGYLDKVMSVTDGDTTRTFTYHADGQLATATVGGEHRAPRDTPQTETFLWDGLALIQRGDEQFVNEPHIGGGNPVASSKGTSYFNDALGTTVGSKSNGKYSAAALSAFGESLETLQGEVTSNIKHQTSNSQNFFTGKPFVEGLGHAFLFRNYRAGLAKWQTADPMGYPDGWNQHVYCGNGVIGAVDWMGTVQTKTFDYLSFEQDLMEGLSGQGMYIPRVPDSSWSVAGISQVLVEEARKAGKQLIDYVLAKYKDAVASAIKTGVQSVVDIAWIDFMRKHELCVCYTYNEALPDDGEIFEKIKEVYGADTEYTPENGWMVKRNACKHLGVVFIENDDPFNIPSYPAAYYFTECLHNWKIVIIKE